MSLDVTEFPALKGQPRWRRDAGDGFKSGDLSTVPSPRTGCYRRPCPAPLDASPGLSGAPHPGSGWACVSKVGQHSRGTSSSSSIRRSGVPPWSGVRPGVMARRRCPFGSAGGGPASAARSDRRRALSPAPTKSMIILLTRSLRRIADEGCRSSSTTPRQDQSCRAISPTVSAERPYPLRVVVGFRLRQRGYGGVLVASQEKESRNE
jgi:hypothetical protein